MNQEFNKLQDEYQKALQEQNEEQQVEIVSRMRANLLQRNNDEELILLSQEGIKLNINTAFYQEIIKINGELNRREVSQKLNSFSSEQRKTETIRSLYSEENQYQQ